MNVPRVIRRIGAVGTVLLSTAALAIYAQGTDVAEMAPDASNFMPHGYCYLWNPLILWLHVVSDSLITLSYYCIPIILVYFVRKNRNIPFNRIFWMFGGFILACGTTHLIEVWNVWHGNYLLAGIVKATTAAISILTTAMLIPLVPQVMSLPQLFRLQELNRKLERQIEERKRFDAPIKAATRRRITGGFVLALLLTFVLGYSSLRGARRAEEDTSWVSHTHEVMETIQRTTRHVIEVETAARAFSLTGEEPLLAQYQANRNKINLDKETLRYLTADNPSQQRRLDVLASRIRAALEFADNIIAKRRRLRAYPGRSDALETEKLMDAVRATSRDMYAEETRLLGQRTERAQTGQQLTRVMALFGVLVGSGLWVLAKFSVEREINVSERARAQISTLNADLEERVERRTEALQYEIAERRQAERALRESEERFQAMANNIPQLAWMAEADGRIFWYNRRWYDYTGTTLEQMQGWGWQIVHEPEVLPKVLEKWKSAIASAVPFEMEFPLRAADGRFGIFLTRITPEKDSAGRVVRWFGTNTDITALKQVEEKAAAQAQELKRSREVLEEQARVLDLAPVVVRDMESRIVFWPRGAEKLYGIPSQQALGAVSHELFRTQFPEPMEVVEKKLAETGRWEGELEHKKRDGSVIVIASTWVLYRNEHGQATRILEVNTDVTARKRAEERLAEQAEEMSRQAEDLASSQQALEQQTRMLKLVLDSMGEGLIAADRQGHFLIWNDSATKLMGRNAADLPSELWTPHYKVFLPDGVTPYPPDRLPLVCALHGESVTVELMIDHPERADGVFLEVTARPLKDMEGQLLGGVAVLRDITERKAAEREIQKLNEDLEVRVIERTTQLEAANKELEAFTYSVSHDLRAPLRHMSGFTRILMEDFGPSLPQEAQVHLQRIEQGAIRMGQLVDELLNLTRVGRQVLAVQVTGLDSIVKDVLALLSPETEDRKIEWKIAALPFVECDPILMRQVFQNLIGNALKYSRPRSPAVIEIGQVQEKGNPVIFVRDNGVGFSMKYADKLFGVFQRLHRPEDFEGTGVGLATVDRIIHKHGGRVWAEAELDRGATFYFTLSGREQSAPENAAAAAGGQQ